MTYAIKYTETAEEIAANVAAVAESAGREYLETLGFTPEEYVEGWADLYVCTDVEGEWSLGGVEPYEADQFLTAADADAWITRHGLSEPGTWEVVPV